MIGQHTGGWCLKRISRPLFQELEAKHSQLVLYSSKFSWHKNFVKHSKLAKLLIFVVKISWLLQISWLVRPRSIVVYVTSIHMARVESRIFVTSALSLVHSKEMPVFSFEAQSCIKGYHIYKAVWMPYIGETMFCSWELTNGHDPFAVKVSQLHSEDKRIVGHLPRKTSSICGIFLRKRWEDFCWSVACSMWKTSHPLILE